MKKKEAGDYRETSMQLSKIILQELNGVKTECAESIDPSRLPYPPPYCGLPVSVWGWT